MTSKKSLIEKGKKELLPALFSLLLLGGVLYFAPMASESVMAAHGSGMTRDEDQPGNTAATTNFRDLAVYMINWILGFVGLVAVCVFIFGGFMYITSGGEQGGMDKGKKAMTYAVIGMGVVLVSFAAVNTILNTWEEGNDDTTAG